MDVLWIFKWFLYCFMAFFAKLRSQFKQWFNDINRPCIWRAWMIPASVFLREIEVNLVSSDTCTAWAYDCLTHTMKVFMSYVWFMRIQVWCRGSCNPSPWFLHVDGVSFRSCHDLRQTMNYQRQWVEAFVVSKHIQCSPFDNFTRSVEQTQPPIVDYLLPFFFHRGALFQYLVKPEHKNITNFQSLCWISNQMEYGAHDDTSFGCLSDLKNFQSYQLYQGPLPPMWNSVWQPPSVRAWVNLTPTGGRSGSKSNRDDCFFWEKFGNDTLLWVSTGKLGLIPLFHMKHQQFSKWSFSCEGLGQNNDTETMRCNFFTFTNGLFFSNVHLSIQQLKRFPAAIIAP